MAMTPEPNASRPASTEESVAPLGQRFLWADTSTGVNRLIIGLIVLCIILFCIDFLYHRHAKVPYESLYGFYAIAGFVAFTLIVLGARLLRLIIRRDESYYEPNGVDAEEYPDKDTERLHHRQRVPDSLSSLFADMTGRDSGDGK